MKVEAATRLPRGDRERERPPEEHVTQQNARFVAGSVDRRFLEPGTTIRHLGLSAHRTERRIGELDAVSTEVYRAVGKEMLQSREDYWEKQKWETVEIPQGDRREENIRQHISQGRKDLSDINKQLGASTLQADNREKQRPFIKQVLIHPVEPWPFGDDKRFGVVSEYAQSGVGHFAVV